jgi:hypothetical protein
MTQKYINCNRLKDLETNFDKEIKGSDNLYEQYNESTSSDLAKKAGK